MKSIIIDITHLPHINFLKNAVIKLKKQNFKIDIVCLDRGKNVNVLKEELPDFNIYVIGKHRGNILSILFEANMLRFLKLLYFLLFRKYDLGISTGSFLLGFALKFKGTPNIQFYDDPENKKNMFLQKLSANSLYYPPFNGLPSKVESFNALKEWAYLSPQYFHPVKEVLAKYNLVPGKYIFVRDVSVSSSNYIGQDSHILSKISKNFPKGYKIILSLEKKENRRLFPDDWILLEEPIKDFHSLLYYSKIIISSGDSMAREGAMLGVPSIYCGVRKMQANEILINKKMLFHLHGDNVPEFISKIIAGKVDVMPQNEFRNQLLNEWDDVTNFIVSKAMKFM